MVVGHGSLHEPEQDVADLADLAAVEPVPSLPVDLPLFLPGAHAPAGVLSPRHLPQDPVLVDVHLAGGGVAGCPLAQTLGVLADVVEHPPVDEDPVHEVPPVERPAELGEDLVPGLPHAALEEPPGVGAVVVGAVLVVASSSAPELLDVGLVPGVLVLGEPAAGLVPVAPLSPRGLSAVEVPVAPVTTLDEGAGDVVSRHVYLLYDIEIHILHLLSVSFLANTSRQGSVF